MTNVDTREVGSGLDVRLLEAIRNEDVPKPALMDFNDWQVWRRDLGKRPLRSRDGVYTTSKFEVTLWRATMLELYGNTWQNDLLSARADALAAEEVDVEAEEVPLASRPETMVPEATR